MSAPDSTTCPGDDELAAFVERTLAGGGRSAIELHLDTCERCREAIAHVAASTTEAAAPGQIGRYRLDRIIGSGGMGVVWQAWDPALERAVAVKVLRPELTDELGRQRMIREARALAKLQHPNVVAVHDVGEIDGELFITTELIDGESMDRWQRGRPAAELLLAYAQAARGLAAAHDLGLVHRDVKPSNILVGKDGRVRIGDFGLATREVSAASAAPAIPPPVRGELTTDERLTEVGTVLGTPAYMAPEQHRDTAVDSRADQYALCVAIAEALLGRRPAAGTSAVELAAGGVRAPWAAIARGLALRPDDRHPSLAPLVAALDRAGAPRRAGRWVAAGVAAVAISAIAVAAWPSGRDPTAACAGRRPLAGTWEPPTRTALRDKLLASKLPYAPAVAEEVIAALDDWSAELAAEDRRTCEDEVTHRQPREVTAQRAQCLRRARDEGAELVARLLAMIDEPIIQRAPASARGLPTPSACNTPAGLAEQTVLADGAVAARVDALTAKITQARTTRHLGKLAEAKALAAQALDEARALGYLPVIASAQQELGTVLHAMADPAAEKTLVDAMTVAAQAHADMRTAAIAALLVEVVGVKGDTAAAERQAALARSANIRVGNDQYIEAVIERGLGRAYHAASQYAAAYEHYKRAEDLHVALGATDDVAFDQRNQVRALGSLDRFDEATRINAAVLDADRRNLGPRHPKTIDDLMSGGILLARAGRYAEAAAELEAARALDAEVSGTDSAHYRAIVARLAAVYMTVGRIADAEPLLAETVRALAAQPNPDAGELRGQRMNLAAAHILLGRLALAEAELTDLVTAARAAGDRESLTLFLGNLAEALTRDGKARRALPFATESLAVATELFGPSSHARAQALETLGAVYWALRDPARSRDAYRRAVEVFEAVVGTDTPELGSPLHGLGLIDLAAGRPALARPLLERAVAVLAGGDPVDLVEAKLDLARALHATGERAAARDTATAALALGKTLGDRAASLRERLERWLAAHP